MRYIGIAQEELDESYINFELFWWKTLKNAEIITVKTYIKTNLTLLYATYTLAVIHDMI